MRVITTIAVRQPALMPSRLEARRTSHDRLDICALIYVNVMFADHSVSHRSPDNHAYPLPDLAEAKRSGVIASPTF